MKNEYNKIDVKNNMKIDNHDDEVIVPKEKERMKKIVDTQPKKVKRGLFSRLVTGIIGPEGLPGIGTYVNEEIVKPAIRNIVYEAIESTARMLMFGERGGRGSYHPHIGKGGYRPSTRYNDQYRGAVRNESRERDGDNRIITRARRGEVERFIIEDKHTTSHVLVSLTDAAERYGSVSVADYYDLIGVDTKFTDNNYGWKFDTIHDARIVPVRGGYVINFPPVEEI